MYLLRIMQSKKLLILFILSVLSFTILILITRDSPINDVDRQYRLGQIDEAIKKQASSRGCKQPKLPVNSSEIMKFLHDVPPINCSAAGPDWVKCEGFECKVQEKVVDIYGPVKCSFTDILRVNDFDSTDGKTTYSDTYYKLEASDVVRVKCKSASHRWSATLTGIRIDEKIWERSSWSNLPKGALKLNVLIFGFDSMSRLSFIRKLPKTYQYMKDVLQTEILEGYNIVGDGTPQALIPILTGKTELELPDTRKRLPNTKYVNTYPFIWNDFRNAGYVTAFLEDVPELSTFTYRLNGFKEVPTDHYMRPYYLASFKEKNTWPKLCTGDQPRLNIMLNQIKNFFNVYKTKPKFLFGFHGELSHDDYNLVGVADNDVYNFLKYLKESKILDNTILIFMSDHGHRFAEIRNTLQGKQEERLPYFSFTFPLNFKKHFSTAFENFKSNRDKLTTPFDIHETLKNVLEINNIGPADISKRAVSLFSKIPDTRSCAHAYIEPHWCACLDWTMIPVTSMMGKRLAEYLIDVINNYTLKYRFICEELMVSTVNWVMKMNPNEDFIKFKKNADYDGFVADMSAKMQLTSDLYQISIKALPGYSVFEASITHHIDDDRLELKISDISRINMYRDQAKCVEKAFPHLRKYCYCVSEAIRY